MLADLHLHTNCSVDGAMRPETVVARALARGLGLVAVTDHDTIRGGRSVHDAARGTGLAVVVGAELTTDAGHIQGLLLDREVLPGVPRPLPWRDAVRAVHAQNGLAVWAHPFRTDRPLDTAVLEEIDGVEIWNGRVRWSRFVAANDRAGLAWRAAPGPLLATAGSDGHCPWEVGAVCLEGPDLNGPLSTAALRQWLEAARRVWACRPPALSQTYSQLLKAGRTKDPMLAARAVGRAIWRAGDTLAPATTRRSLVWTRDGEGG